MIVSKYIQNSFKDLQNGWKWPEKVIFRYFLHFLITFLDWRWKISDYLYNLRFFFASFLSVSSITSKPLHKQSRGLKNSIKFQFLNFYILRVHNGRYGSITNFWNYRRNLTFETISEGVHIHLTRIFSKQISS